jgi:hypothetical protein
MIEEAGVAAVIYMAIVVPAFLTGIWIRLGEILDELRAARQKGVD